MAGNAPIGHEIEVAIARFDQGQSHPRPAFDAGHIHGGLKARAGRRRSDYVRHRIPISSGGRRNAIHLDAIRLDQSINLMSDSKHSENKAFEITA